MRKRDFLAGGLALGAGWLASAAVVQAQGRGGGVPRAMARTRRLFRSPGMFPNALAGSPQGLWIGQQKNWPAQAAAWGVPMPTDLDEAAWLVDWNGKLQKTIITKSRNTSGIAWGNNSLWMGANADPFGIFQIDPVSGRQIGHRPIPLGMNGQGGGCHGLKIQNGKMWIAALRLGGALRIDPVTWVPEVLIRVASEDKPRLHDIAFDANGDLWVVTGNNSRSYAEMGAGLNKYDGKTGQLVLTVDFPPGSCDPHGLEFHNGTMISCDAGNHPNWKENESPHSGWIFSIELT